MRLRKRINKDEILRLINNNYRYCDIIRSTGIAQGYFYRLLKQWKAEGKVNVS